MANGEWLEHDGREVDSITWADTETDKGQQLTRTPVQKLVLHAEYMGDRTEVWVGCYRDGKEVARHNARMIESIVWMQ